MKKLNFIYLFITFILISALPVQAVTLKWDIPLGERLELVRTAKVQEIINKKLARLFEERNIVDLTCYKKKGKLSAVKGLFSIFHRDANSKVFHLREQYKADFEIEEKGRFHVPQKQYMPNLRHLPTFPEKDIKVGHVWKARAALVLNTFSVPFQLLFPVNYKLEAVEKKNGKEYAVISYNYLIDKDLRGSKMPVDFPLKIYGKSIGKLHWDLKKHSPMEMTEVYRIIFVLRTGLMSVGSDEFRMNIDSRYKVYAAVTKDQKEKAKNELKKELPESSGIDVDIDKRGIVLRLGEVFFDTDSAQLRGEAKKKLQKAIEIIKKKYSDREIVVEGHTDSTGTRKHNQNLSQKRARSVAEYFKSRGGHDKLSFRGLGPDNPIADNKTKAGRQKNRRVEIIIKLH